MAQPVAHQFWRLLPAPPGVADLHPALWGAFHRRGLTTAAQRHLFLNPSLQSWGEPLELLGMEKAVDLVLTAMNQKQRICIYGDYDADGLTGAVALWRLLKPRYDNLGVYLPLRQEGYGLSVAGLTKLKESGVSLVITVDNGTTATQAVQAARDMGMTVLITDHHQPGGELPNAHAHINPHLPGCGYGFKDLSGCAVAFKLGVAVARRLGLSEEQAIEEEVDLLALSSLSDRMALTGENRFFSRQGLSSISQGRRLGLKALKEQIGLKPGRALTGYDMDFQIIPRLNASGRMGNPMVSFQLLVAQETPHARQLAKKLETANQTRKQVQGDVYREISRRLKKADPPWAVVEAGQWHFGVLGVVAGRLAESYARPTVLLCPSGEKQGSDELLKGSCRNPTHADLLGALRLAVGQGIATKAGGHHAAQGVELPAAALGEFTALIQETCQQQLSADPPSRTLELDGPLTLTQADEPLLATLEKMEPFGPGNPTPVFLMENLKVDQAQYRGGDLEHLKLQAVDQQGRRATLMFFQGGRLMTPSALQGACVNAAVTVARGQFPGDGPVALRVQDLCLSGS